MGDDDKKPAERPVPRDPPPDTDHRRNGIPGSPFQK